LDDGLSSYALCGYGVTRWLVKEAEILDEQRMKNHFKES
jgi:hypothetical protein